MTKKTVQQLPRGGGLRMLGVAAIWGVATWVMEIAVLPIPNFGDVTVIRWLVVSLALFPQWAMVGAGMALCIMLAAARLEGAHMVPVAGAFALAWGVLASVLFMPAACLLFGPSWPVDTFFFPGLRNGQCDAERALGAWAYATWEMLVIAAIFTPIYVLNTRAERIRRLLVHAEIARRQTDEVVEQAQFQALRKHVDPKFLSDTLAEIQRRFLRDPEAADHLLDRLVTFLRMLMPGLRNSMSTLGSELEIAIAHARVNQESRPGATDWAIDVRGENLGEVGFPAMLLIPTIDDLSIGTGSHASWSIRVTRYETGLLLEVRVANSVAPAVQRQIERQWHLSLLAVNNAPEYLSITSTNGETSLIARLRGDRVIKAELRSDASVTSKGA